MKKTIYAKYSNDRTDKFKILTRILEEDGEKRVEKIPLTKSAEKHLHNIQRWYEELNKMCADTEMHINKCVYENGIAKLEYINGYTLEEQMLKLYSTGKYDELYDLFDNYVERLNKLATEKFELSDEFKNVFGDVPIDNTSACMKVTDVDIIFSNILTNEAGWHIIDYEWTFDFLIPIRFVIYRAIAAFLNVIAACQCAKVLDLFGRVGISDEEIQIYQNMENAFQIYVKDGYFSLNDMYQTHGKRNIPVWNVVEYDNLMIRMNEANDMNMNSAWELEELICRVKSEAEQSKSENNRLSEEQNRLNEEQNRLNEEINRLNEEVNRLNAENARLNTTLNDIYRSKKWRLVTKLAKLRTGGR